MAKVSARGGLHLFWGIVLSTVISAAGVIVLARVLQPENYGLYTIALAAPNLIGTFRDWGMNSAMIKYTAQYTAEEKPNRVRSILLSGLIFEVVLGVALTFVSFALSGFIAADIFRRPITALIEISSVTILAGGLLNAAQAAFTGWERMQPNSVTLVTGALFRSVLSPVLVFIGFGVSGAVVGYAAGTLAGGSIGVLFMMLIYRTLRGNGEPLKLWETTKFMFNYALPLSFSSIFNSFLAQFYNIVIAIYASNRLIGNYAVANNFTVLLTFFATPITTMLFPAFSKMDAQKDRKAMQTMFRSSIKYSTLLVVPPTVAVMALANPVVAALFGVRYASAPLFLALLSINYILTAFGQLSTLNLISGQGKTRFYLELAIINTVAGIILALTLVPTIGVVGLIITTIFDGVPGLIISLDWIEKNYGATVDWVSSAKILLSSSIAGIITYFAVSYSNFGNWTNLAFGIVVFLAIFVAAAIGLRAVRKPDIYNLQVMTSGLGPLSGFFDRVLRLLSRLVSD